MSSDRNSAIADHMRSVLLLRLPDGSGSGFYAGPRGMVVTNRHVVGNAQMVEATRHDRTRVELRVIRTAVAYDLALLLDERDDAPPPLPLADPSLVVSGQNVYAIGHPAGLDFTVTRGIVSASNRRVKNAYFVQTDAVAHPGSSGGPLMDDQGNVVGVATFGLEHDGLNFALSVRYVAELLGEVVIATSKRPRVRCPSCNVGNDAARNHCRQCGVALRGNTVPDDTLRVATELDQVERIVAELTPPPAAIERDDGSIAFTRDDVRITAAIFEHTGRVCLTLEARVNNLTDDEVVALSRFDLVWNESAPARLRELLGRVTAFPASVRRTDDDPGLAATHLVPDA